METSFPNTNSAKASRTLEEAQAMAEASGIPAPKSQREIEESQAALQKRIDQFRHAEVKREFAPVSLGGISAAIAAVLAFTSQKERELLDVIRNLRGDHRAGLKPAEQEINPAVLKRDNERLKQLVTLYDEHEGRYNLLRHGMSEAEMASKIEKNIAPDPLRENLGSWLQREYAGLKTMDNVSLNETLDKKFSRYKKETFKVFRQVNEDVKNYAQKHGIDFVENAKEFTGNTEKFVQITNYPDAAQAEHHMGKIANLYERAYIKITSARQEFRTAIDREVLLKIRQMGKRMGFRDLTNAAKTRSFMFAGVVSVAVGACVYALIKFITKESPEERQERQQLQATKEWELAQASAGHGVLPLAQDLATGFSSPHIQALAAREPQSHTERLANASTQSAILER